MDTDVVARLTTRIADAGLADLHGVVVLVGDERVAEHYGAGDDFTWSAPLGEVTFGPETLHDIRSVSKSVTGLLYGIALARGAVPEPSAPLMPLYPEYADLAADPGRCRLTVAHALTMSLGIEWREDLPYTTPENSEIAMELAPDRYRYVLERPIVEEPGRRWRYCGGATALLGQLIERGTGDRLGGFARTALFEPLGIDRFEWMAGSDGIASPASGLRLAPRDLARIGRAVLGGGAGVIPARWIEVMLAPRISIGDGFAYGYHWYLGAFPPATGRPALRWFGGMGNGGQRLVVVPERDLVVAITCGAYDAEDQSAAPDRVMELVLASLG